MKRFTWFIIIALIAGPLSFSETQTADEEWEGLRQQALSILKSGDHQEALNISQRMLELAEKEIDPKKVYIAESYLNLGNMLFSLGDLDRAGAYYIKAYEAYGSVEHKDAEKIASLMNNLGIIVENKGELERAVKLYNGAISIYETREAGNRPNVATFRDNLGRALYEMGEYDEAEKQLKKALSIYEEAGDEFKNDLAINTENLANLYLKIGRYEEAVQFSKKAFSIRRKLIGEDNHQLIPSLNQLVKAYFAWEKFEQAEIYVERALAIQKIHPDLPPNIEVMNYAGLLYFANDKPEKAEDVFKSVLEIETAQLGDQDPALLNILNNLLLISRTKDESADFEAYAMKVETLVRANMDKPTLDMGTTLNNLAEYYQMDGNHEKSHTMYEMALSLMPESDEWFNRYVFSGTMKNFGLLLLKEENFVEAEEYCKRALKIRIKFMGDSDPLTADTFAALGEVYLDSDELKKAEKHFQKALAIYESQEQVDPDSMASILENMANLYNKLGRDDEVQKLQKRREEYPFEENDM